MADFEPRLDEMLTQHCREFSGLFVELCRKLFKDDNDAPGSAQLFHSGSFGSLREYTCERFLQPFTPRRFRVRSGFLVSSIAIDGPPKQCDLLICDRDATPFIDNMELGPFFPAEAIAALGEVKSRLHKHEFQKAIIQISMQIEQILQAKGYPIEARAALKVPPKVMSDDISFLPIHDVASKITKLEYSDFFSFLICEAISDKKPHTPSAWNGVLDESASWNVTWPDAILSIRDGLLLRQPRKHDSASDKGKTLAVLNADTSLSHLKAFLAVYFGYLSRWKQAQLNLAEYLRFHPTDIFCEVSNQDSPRDGDSH